MYKTEPHTTILAFTYTNIGLISMYFLLPYSNILLLFSQLKLGKRRNMSTGECESLLRHYIIILLK